MKQSVFLIFFLILFGKFQVAGQTSEQLQEAYKERSTEKLKAFLDQWSNDLRPSNSLQRQEMSKVVQQAYLVFEEFYNPHDLANRGGTQWGNDIYNGYNYFIIQDSFKIFQKDKVYYTPDEAEAYAIDYVKRHTSNEFHEKFINWIKAGNKMILENYGPSRNSIWEDSTKVLLDSVNNFRPNIVSALGTPLFLTKKYKIILNDFLGNDNRPFGEEGLINTAQAKGESLRRQKFLENLIKIYYAHWGGHWEYLTGMSVGALVFDRDMKYAKIFYGIIYESGEAYLRFENNRWNLISIKRTHRE